MMHIKNFNDWNKEKQYIHSSHQGFHCRPRQIWWCSLGINIGSEIDGKNGQFERPVIIIKFISKEMLLVVPLTTKGFPDRNHFEIKTKKTTSFAKITQIRTMSSKRLLRQIDTLSEDLFLQLKSWISDFIGS